MQQLGHTYTKNVFIWHSHLTAHPVLSLLNLAALPAIVSAFSFLICNTESNRNSGLATEPSFKSKESGGATGDTEALWGEDGVRTPAVTAHFTGKRLCEIRPHVTRQLT